MDQENRKIKGLVPNSEEAFSFSEWVCMMFAMTGGFVGALLADGSGIILGMLLGFAFFHALVGALTWFCSYLERRRP